MECFFKFLMLNISSIKELLYKPSKIQWNITGNLPGKLKRKIPRLYPIRYYPLKSQKCEKLLFWGYFRDLGTNVEFNGFIMISWISESFSPYLLIKSSFNFKLVFFTSFEYNSGGIIRKNIFTKVLSNKCL